MLTSSGIMIFNKKISMVIILLEGLQELKRKRVLPRDKDTPNLSPRTYKAKLTT